MKNFKTGWLLVVGMVGFVVGLGLSGCLQTSELICTGGTTECNVTCVYLNADPANCGGCGIACQPGTICVGPPDGGLGVCQCPAGIPLPDGGNTIVVCGGACVDLTTSAINCGGCGNVCPSNLPVCAPTDGGSGECQLNCGTAVECNGACVLLDSDPNNCGSCGNTCGQGYSCHATPNGPTQGDCKPDVVALCNSPGTVLPIVDSPVAPVLGVGEPAGSFPGGLGLLGGGLLVAGENALKEFAVENFSKVSPESPVLGSGPDFLEVDARSTSVSFTYVVDGAVNTLTILTGPPASTAQVLLPDGGVLPLGLTMSGGYVFGQNTVPQPYARVGNEIFVPLYGSFPPEQTAGGTVVRLDLTTPTAPVLVGSYDLNGLALPTFDGGMAIPRPSQALFHNGFVYVVLNNLDGNYNAAGPSLLVKIDPAQPPDGGQGGIAQVVTLDSTVCLDALAMTENGDRLLVSCFGQAQFDMNFNTVAVDRSGLLSLDTNDVLLSSYAPQCRPDAGAGCIPPIAGSLALVNGRVYLADQSSGRLFVVSVNSTGALSEFIGYGPDGGVPLQPCPAGLSAVTGVLRVP